MTNIYVPLVMVIAQADCFASFLMETEYNLKQMRLYDRLF